MCFRLQMYYSDLWSSDKVTSEKKSARVNYPDFNLIEHFHSYLINFVACQIWYLSFLSILRFFFYLCYVFDSVSHDKYIYLNTNSILYQLKRLLLFCTWTLVGPVRGCACGQKLAHVVYDTYFFHQLQFTGLHSHNLVNDILWWNVTYQLLVVTNRN